MKTKTIILYVTMIFVATSGKAQVFDIYTDTIAPWGHGTVMVDIAIYDSVRLHPPNWMIGPWTFESPGGLPNNGYSSMTITPSTEGTWTIVNAGQFPYEEITVTVLFDNITNTSENKRIPFTIYPNPAYEEINISIGLNDFQVEVLTMLGQVTLREYNVKTLNISNLPQGTYIISIIVDGRRSNRIFTKN